MKTVKHIWDALRPHQTDEQLARLMRCKAERLEALNKELAEVLADLMAEKSGKPKSCRHDFDCVCASDKARVLLEKIKGE